MNDFGTELDLRTHLVQQSNLDILQRATDRVVGKAWVSDGLILYPTIDHAGDEAAQWAVFALGPDLYGGLPGVALTLSLAARFLKRHDAMITAEHMVEQSAQAYLSLDRDATSLKVGPFSGVSGVLYAAEWHHRLTGRRPIGENTFSALLDLCERCVQNDSDYDIMSGSAGAMRVAAEILRSGSSWPSSKFQLASLVQHAYGHLLDSRKPLEDGRYSWDFKPSGGRRLRGFSHGWAGVAWSLATAPASSRSNDAEETLDLASDWMLWSNQPDSKDHPFARAEQGDSWCHGFTGVLLSQLDAFPVLTPRPEFLEVFEKLVTGDVKDDSLCHGRSGILLTALRVHRWLPVPPQELSEFIVHCFNDLQTSLDTESVVSGLPGGPPCPGLLLGDAGVLMTLLCCAFEVTDAMPLLLELPADA